jgi:predicted tellurium resistance membrane protein TerC
LADNDTNLALWIQVYPTPAKLVTNSARPADPRRHVGAPSYATVMQFLAVLIGVALVVKYWWVIVGGVGLIVFVTWVRRVVDRHAERVEAERRRLAEIAERADQQHDWAMQGDPRGTYGSEFPAAPT